MLIKSGALVKCCLILDYFLYPAGKSKKGTVVCLLDVPVWICIQINSMSSLVKNVLFWVIG